MYTRCPNCRATFRITDAVLQMAEGEVQCGSCDTVFDARLDLFDDSGSTITWTGADDHDPTISPDRSDAAAAGTDDTTLEFSVPEQEWQQFFDAPEEEAPASHLRSEPALGGDFEGLAAEFTETGTLDEETADVDTWQGFLREAEPDDDEEHPAVVVDEPEEVAADPVIKAIDPAELPVADSAADVDDGRERATGDDTATRRPPSDAPSPPADGAPAQPETAGTILDWNPTPAFPDRAMRPVRNTGAWLAACVVAALALAAQLIHHSRDALAADPRVGDGIRAVYQRLHQPLYPNWPLDAYEIRGAKAIVENSAPGVLDVIAEIAVTGTQPVGLPMVRVVLRDRWSNPLASGVFDPAAYLAQMPTAPSVYAAGSLIPVTISLKDPGTAAQGYELDVCLPNRHFGLQCKSARDPFRR